MNKILQFLTAKFYIISMTWSFEFLTAVLWRKRRRQSTLFICKCAELIYHCLQAYEPSGVKFIFYDFRTHECQNDSNWAYISDLPTRSFIAHNKFIAEKYTYTKRCT